MQRTFSVFKIISLEEISRSEINGSKGMDIFQGSWYVLLNISKEAGMICTPWLVPVSLHPGYCWRITINKKTSIVH